MLFRILDRLFWNFTSNTVFNSYISRPTFEGQDSLWVVLCIWWPWFQPKLTFILTLLSVIFIPTKAGLQNLNHFALKLENIKAFVYLCKYQDLGSILCEHHLLFTLWPKFINTGVISINTRTSGHEIETHTKRGLSSFENAKSWQKERSLLTDVIIRNVTIKSGSR